MVAALAISTGYGARMNALARLAVVGLIALAPGCTTDKPADPAPPSTPTQADIPPPLVPAMPLPENAVDKAIAKLDGIAEELMRQSGIPGMAVAVVYRGNRVRERFRRQRRPSRR